MSGAIATDPDELVLGRYGELWLKGKNRRDFERALQRATKHALEQVAPVRLVREGAQLLALPTPEAAGRVGDLARRMAEVFGFSSISRARTTASTPDAIAATAATVLADALDAYPRGRAIPFRVETRRADKSFPMVSTELDRYVADRVLGPYEDRLTVDLSHPELTLGIQVRAERSFVYAERIPGAGGLPVGTLGRGVALLSGGIDSPVASWMAMKRGMEVVFCAFHSFPYIGESYLAKVRRLVARLARFQVRSVLVELPFAAIQTAIRDGGPPAYRTVLYRRAMQRLACRVAAREKARALVTGESLGQVASQTLENLTCIGAASTLPVLRPLVAFDKTETITLARRIGTYDLSIEPEPDCCTVFQPKKPILRGRLEVCEDAERTLDLEPLLEESLAGAERHVVEPS